MKSENPPRRYHPALVSLHWLIALLLLTELVLGLSPHFFPHWAPRPLQLQIHMILGIATLAAVLLRVGIRLAMPKPAHATTGNPFFDFIGKATHVLLYLLVIGLSGSGLFFAYQARILSLVVGQRPLHRGYFPEDLHVLLVVLLGLLVLFHMAAAFYHQLIRKDRLFSRMSWGRGVEPRASVKT